MKVTSLLAIAIFLLGCAAEEPVTRTATVAEEAAEPLPPPTPDEASALVAESAPFGDYLFSTGSAFSLPIEAAAMNEPARLGAEDLRKAGWIRIASGRVELTEKAEGDKRFLVRPNGFIDIVPLARKELVEVVAVRPTEDGVDVDFRWRWNPNEVGSAFTRGLIKERFDATHEAAARLQDFGSGWEVVLIERRDLGAGDDDG